MAHIELFLSHLDQIIAGFGLFGAIFFVIKNRQRRPQLNEIILCLLAFGMIPIGIAFIICAFQPDMLQKINSINIYIAAAGCSILYVAWDAAK